MAQLVVALVAIHALGKRELANLHTDDLHLARGRLTVHRARGTHTVYLDDLTHTLATAWLRERHRRWPATTNQRLLISQQTAAMNTDHPIADLVLTTIFNSIDINASALRQDRILDEATRTADPIHLMRVFGISTQTAMRYLNTAHPQPHGIPR
jgi:hypothetical protein